MIKLSFLFDNLLTDEVFKAHSLYWVIQNGILNTDKSVANDIKNQMHAYDMS
jgi:hypothetical protein